MSAVLEECPVALKGNVLVIEDDPDTGDFIKKAVLHAGYGVRLVRNRDEATGSLSRYLYDFIVMDYWMPGLSAEKFLTLVSRLQPGAKVVLLTAADKAPEIAERLNLSSWIGKPFSPEDLTDSLHN